MENKPKPNQTFPSIAIGVTIVGVVTSCAMDGIYGAFGGFLTVVGVIMTLLAFAWRKRPNQQIED